MPDIKKLVICSAAVVAVVAVSGYLVYKKYIVPTYIEPILETTADILRDSEVQELISETAQKLVDNGTLDKSTFKNYERNVSQYTDYYGESDFDEDDDISPSVSTDTTLLVSNARSGSELGIESVNTDPTAKGTTEQKLSDKFKQNKDEDEISLDKKVYEMGQEDEVIDTGEKKDSAELYNKIISVMTSHERSVFYSVMWKADKDTLRSIYIQGDKEAAKEYLHSILSDEEYKEAVSIFFKYAHMLVE